jgi:class 3 adenylate cyclase
VRVRADLPRGTVTFLFTDVEGSTRLLRELGAERYAVALDDHRRIVRGACLAWDGVEVDTQGDAFFLAFPTATRAVEAAEQIASALGAGAIRLRIGLHTGVPLVTEEGYVGEDVHLAARVAAAGHGGQILLTEATAALAGREVLELGEHRLKDVDAAVRILQLGSGRFPALRTVSSTNLPVPPSSFVGRERELADVLGRVAAGARLVTLTGPGGAGKTRLAIEAARALAPEFEGGTFWAGLATLREPARVHDELATALGAREGLAAHIGGRRLLVVVDNFEQVVAAAPQLSALLAACPGLTLLVTSRELLRVQGEVEIPVPPLAEPDAVALFSARSGLEASEEIRELCERLDSLPLAVELAAARARALSPAQILERLRDRLELRAGRDAEPRQQTLRSTIAWSYELLSDNERRLFARLSVFAGGCRLEAAEGVVDADVDTLQSLVEKSLLRWSSACPSGRQSKSRTAPEPARSTASRQPGSSSTARATKTPAPVRSEPGSRWNVTRRRTAKPSSFDGGSRSRSARICDVGARRPGSRRASARSSSGSGRAPSRSRTRSTRLTCAWASGVSSQTHSTPARCSAAASST